MASNTLNQIGRFDYVPTLDGWRAVAVLGVICFHCAANSGLWPGSLLWKICVRGNIGVDVFFAISGFLIGGKLLQEFRDTQTISLKRFYLRRCFRIIPAMWFYLAVLALLTAGGWLTTHNWEYSSTLLFVRNYFPLNRGTYTAQFWTLGIEEYFYLLWPGAMLLVGPKIQRMGAATLVVALSVLAWRSIDSIYGWWIPFGTDIATKTDTRIDALLWGCLAAFIYPSLQTHLKRSTLRYGLWVVIGFVVVTVDLKFVEFSLIRAILLPAMLIATAMSPTSIVSRFLELPAMRWLGRISYSMYIWQQLGMFPASHDHSPLAVIQQFPYNIPIVLVVAAVSYYIVELPMIRLGRRLAKHQSTGRPERLGRLVGRSRTASDYAR